MDARSSEIPSPSRKVFALLTTYQLIIDDYFVKIIALLHNCRRYASRKASLHCCVLSPRRSYQYGQNRQSKRTTLLNVLGGLDAPTGGVAHWRDHNLITADEGELTRYRREHVGFVFQFYNLIPNLTARENIALVTDMAENPMGAEEALTLVGLSHRLDHFPSQLSGGEQQRVAIAHAIAKRPDVLLCDEPTGALDYPTGKIVLEVLARANHQLGTTVVVISHNVAIGRMGDRVMYLADGRIVRTEVNAKKLSAAELQW